MPLWFWEQEYGENDDPYILVKEWGNDGLDNDGVSATADGDGGLIFLLDLY